MNLQGSTLFIYGSLSSGKGNQYISCVSSPTEGFSSPSDKSSLDGAVHLKATLVTIGIHTVRLIALHAYIMFTIEISFTSIILQEIVTISQENMEHLVVTVQMSLID